MKLFRVLASTLVAIIILSALVGTSAAGRLSFSSQTFRAGFVSWKFNGGFGTTDCALTLEGSLHSRTIAKVAGSLIGYITRAGIGICIGGSATILTASLPWHVRYRSFTGTLPNISAVLVNMFGVTFQIREPTFGITCLASGGTMNMTYNREAGGNLTTAVLGGTSPTNCGIEGTISGTSNSLTVLGGTARMTVTLI